jgi:hypothetical protein
MDIDATPGRTFVLKADETELLILNNALNEICNGLSVPEFEARIGASPDMARALLGAIGAALDAVS